MTHWSWLLWLNVILGAWLIVSPFVFGYTMYNTMFWNDVVVGIVVAVVSLFSYYALTRSETRRA